MFFFFLMQRNKMSKVLASSNCYSIYSEYACIVFVLDFEDYHIYITGVILIINNFLCLTVWQ